MKKLVPFLLLFIVYCLLFIVTPVRAIVNPLIATTPEPFPRNVSRELIVVFKEIPTAQIVLDVVKNTTLSELKYAVINTNALVFNVTGGDLNSAIAELSSNSSIQSVFVNRKLDLLYVPNDPAMITPIPNGDKVQWNMYKIKVAGSGQSAWDISRGSGNVVVAVIDSGIDSSHEDFQGKLHSLVVCTPTCQTVSSMTADPLNYDQSHGTHVAGLVAAATDNRIGMAGAGFDSKIMAIKIQDSYGEVLITYVVNAFVWAADHGAKVINISLGALEGNLNAEAISQINNAVNYAWSKGVVVVAAAGNCGQGVNHLPTGDPCDIYDINGNYVRHTINEKYYPAASPNVISVAALDYNNNLTYYSERNDAGNPIIGNWVSVAAPGGQFTSSSDQYLGIPSTWPSNQYLYNLGTSMAAPHVAGVAALLFAAKPTLTNGQVKGVIEQNANHGIASGVTNFGAVDALAALLASVPNISPSTTPSPTTGLSPTRTPTPGSCPYYCTDTDGGKNYGTKGFINSNWSGWSPNVPDKCAVLINPGNYSHQTSCSGSNCYLIELYCLANSCNSSPQYDIVGCSQCNDGVCSSSNTPTPINYKSPTPAGPTLTQSVKKSPTPLPTISGECLKNNIGTLVCFEYWRREYLGLQNSKFTDFNNDSIVDLVDFEIWRRNFRGTSIIPTNTPAGGLTPTSFISPTIIITQQVKSPTPTTIAPTITSFISPTVTPPITIQPPQTRAGIWVSPQELANLPTGGAAWSNLKSIADGSLGTANLSDQDTRHNLRTMAVALVYARIGGDNYRSKAANAIMSIIGTENNPDKDCSNSSKGARSLALGRNLAAYVIAADLINLQSYNTAKDQSFRSWLQGVIRRSNCEGRTVITCHEVRPNNWGTMCGASRIATDIYLNDNSDLQKAILVFKGYIGDRSAHSGFSFASDAFSFMCDTNNPRPLNPVGCIKDGHDLSGAPVDDIQRAGAYKWPPNHTDYAWGGFSAAAAQAELLYRAGFDAYNWENQGILRGTKFLEEVVKFAQSGATTWVKWIVNRRYNTNFSQPSTSVSNRLISFTDWTHAK